MVEKLKSILKELNKANKSVSLLAVLKMDDLTDRWSIILSSPIIEDEKSRREVFEYFVKLLLRDLDDKEKLSIARVGAFPPGNHLVENLMEYKKGYEFTGKTPVNGNIVHEGYILESRDIKKSSQTELVD